MDGDGSGEDEQERDGNSTNYVYACFPKDSSTEARIDSQDAQERR